MDNQEVTNLILNYYASRGYKVRLTTEIERNEDSEKPYVQVQISVPLGFEDEGQFAFFYANDAEDRIHYSAVYETANPIPQDAMDDIADNSGVDFGVFDSIMESDDCAFHIFGSRTAEEITTEFLARLEAQFADPFGLPATLAKLVRGIATQA